MTDNQQPPADMVEAACKAFCANYWLNNPAWEHLPRQSRDSLRSAMRAAHAAAQPYIEADKAAAVRKAVEAERERCTKVADEWRVTVLGEEPDSDMMLIANSVSPEIAKAIRGDAT